MNSFKTTAAALVATTCLISVPIFARAEQPPTNATPPSIKYPDEAPFLSDNNTAMDKMMSGMNVEPTGDVDADFAAMMIPHHQGAIDMAIAELRYGKNEQLRRIAQEIIVDQQQEIAAMNLALGKPLPPSSAAPTQVSVGPPPVTSSTALKGNAPNPHNSMSMSPMNHMKNLK